MDSGVRAHGTTDAGHAAVAAAAAAEPQCRVSGRQSEPSLSESLIQISGLRNHREELEIALYPLRMRWLAAGYTFAGDQSFAFVFQPLAQFSRILIAEGKGHGENLGSSGADPE